MTFYSQQTKTFKSGVALRIRNLESAVFFDKLSGIRIRNFSAEFGFQFFSQHKFLILRYLFHVKTVGM